MGNELETLPRLIRDAAAALEKATTAPQLLEAKERAGLAYDAAKHASRLPDIKRARDAVLACHRMQADALMIEVKAQCRFADEYDAGQERGEITKHVKFGRKKK